MAQRNIPHPERGAPRGARREQSRDVSNKSSVGKRRDETDYARLHALTDADIQNAVADDPETFIPDASWWKRARVVLPGAKEMVTLRLDPDVLAWFRKSGRGYQTRINAVLRAFVEAQK
jgi:uncharacterized protein (DUF4415 family)